jgi:hypothetical protein
LATDFEGALAPGMFWFIRASHLEAGRAPALP